MKASLNYKDIHPQFKLNGVSHGFDELKEVGYSLIKEGNDHEKHIGDFLSDWLDDASTLEVKTSGSTGIPKTILLEKQQMVNSAIATGDFFDLKARHTALLCLPVEYIAGKMMLVRALILGLELDYVSPSSNPLEFVDKSYDFCAMIPLQLQNTIDKIEQIKTLIVGGAAVSTQLKNQVQHKSTRVFETYGMTETITHVALKKVNHSTDSSAENNFKALLDVSFSKDKRGCLIIEASKVTSERVITNDLVRLVSDREFEWLGRYDNVINSGGIKLSPEQIEVKLTALITQPFFVAGLEDETLGQKLVLLVEGNSDSGAILSKISNSHLLERFEIPKAIYFLSKFATTDNGKIRRKENLQLIRS